MTEELFAEKVKKSGGRVFVVGGWVRDYFRGETPKDKDYVITGLDMEDFVAAFPCAEAVGKSFPVFHLRIGEEMAEVSLARRERKIASGYKGFAVWVDKTVTIEEDLFRRDTTINAMAMELPDGKLFDPYGGRRDIEAGVIRAVSHHFSEDPVRALRAARQAAEFGFAIAPGTVASMAALQEELRDEPVERVFGEMEKALKAEKPSVFFRSLKEAELLPVVFPEIAALIGKTQPVEYHPEGDAFEHTMQVLDIVSGKTTEVIARFAALVHDLGKGTTPKEMEPHHYGHEQRGLTELEKWNKRMCIPRKWYQTAEFVIREHMRVPRLEKCSKMVDVILAISRLPIEPLGVLAVFAADHHGLPEYLADYEENARLLLSVSGREAPQKLSGPAVGNWIREQQVRLLKNKYEKAKAV